MNQEKRLEIDKKIMLVTRTFLEHPGSMESISKRTKIPASSVQRYLNDKRIIELLDRDTYDRIQALIRINTTAARSKGGYVSSKNNIAIKDNDGKFIGSIRK